MSAPIYTRENCNPAYQLNWAISLFGNDALPDIACRHDAVSNLLESDGIRILEQRLRSSSVLLFLVSTTPDVAPSRILQRLKGRIQHAIRATHPRALRRNYRLESVGSAKQIVLDAYVAKQPARHPMADPRAHEILQANQIRQPNVNLTKLRYTAHGQFIYNLHIVLEHEAGWRAVDDQFWKSCGGMILRVCRKKGWLLSRGGIAANHLHLTLGCNIEDVPAEVVLSVMNNLAHVHGMKAIYRFGYFVGTFGNFDLGALWHAQRKHVP